MQHQYKVAVIIPTLNEEKFIEQCVESVIRQSFPFSEMDVMIIDGGSTDKTTDIVKALTDDYSNIRLIQNPGKIQSIAFNIGVRESTAPYIVRLDAHVLYSKDYIEKCIDLIKSNNSYGNVGGICIIKASRKGLVPEASAILNQVKFGIGGAAFRVGNEAGEVDSVPFGTFPREVLEKVGGMREDLARGEDNEINSRIRKNGYKVYIDPKIQSTYFSRDTIKANMRQMYANGMSIGRLLFIDRESVSLRRLVPLTFVAVIIVCMALGLIWTPLFALLGIVLGAYLLADLAATVSACRKFGWKYVLVLPLLFFLVHVSYGWGTIIGIVKGK